MKLLTTSKKIYLTIWNLGDKVQVAIICEVSSNQPIGIIGKDKHNIGFISDSNELNEILDYIIDKNVIELPYNENLNGNNLLRVQDFDIHSKQYFIALNYILPEKWKILGSFGAGHAMERRNKAKIVSSVNPS